VAPTPDSIHLLDSQQVPLIPVVMTVSVYSNWNSNLALTPKIADENVSVLVCDAWPTPIDRFWTVEPHVPQPDPLMRYLVPT
jgi:hypothetical protein